MTFKMSLAGDLGSGKSTVAKILMDRTGAEYYGTGVIAREIAAKYGMDIAAFNIYMETHPELDKEFDNRLMALSDDPRTLIVDSRMAWHFVEGTFRIYLTTDPESAAIRVMRAGRETEHFDSLEEATNRIRARKESEKKRYFELYGVNCKDLANYNLVIDTTYASPEEVADRILAGLTAWQADKTYAACYLCPRRLRYPEDAPEMATVGALAAAIERKEACPTVTVTQDSDNFYVTDGTEAALAYTLCDAVFVPCVIKSGTVDTAAFVKMEDSL